MKRILEMVNRYHQILLYRHVNPDDDAFGCQAAMYHFLTTYFPDKHVVLMGAFTIDLYHHYFDEAPIQDVKDEPSLAIVMDTSNKPRIDGPLDHVETIIKIDHHIIVDQYGDLNIVEEGAISCAQILTLMFDEVKQQYPLTKAMAEPLFMGIVGDSNRFYYQDTDASTFRAASLLLETGIDIDALYRKMYLKTRTFIDIRRFIVNNLIEDDGVAYYVMSDDDLKSLQISRELGSMYVTELADIDEFKIWIAFTENKEAKNWRVSMRSRDYPVNLVAQQFNGGGHRLAAGATLDSYDQIKQLVECSKTLLQKD